MADPSAEFKAAIYKTGINPVVNVPAEVVEAVRRAMADRGIEPRAGYIPVRGTVNDTDFRATLVPVRAAPYRLYINGDLRRAAGVGAGDNVAITLRYDPDPRIEPMPDYLRESLEMNPAAKAAWDGFAPSHRREVLQYLNYLKREETLRGRVDGLILDLEKKGS